HRSRARPAPHCGDAESTSELPRLDDFGREIKYSRWDGTQRLDALEADELLGAMSDELLSGGDLEDAMARLARWGMPGRMEGMQDLLERLRAAKQKRAERHDLSGIFDELKEKLEEVKRLEREGLDRRERQETADEALMQAMRSMAQARREQLDALPDDVGRAIRGLKDYEFVEPKAAEKYQELLKQLQQQVLGSYFKNMRDSLKGLTPEQLERTRQMIRDLNRALKERMEGGEPDFEAFQRQYPELAGGAKDWDDLLRQLAQGMAAMQSLWQSMSAEMRDQLEGMLGAAFSDPGLQSAMSDLAETLSQLMPMDGYDHAVSGDEPMTLADALGSHRARTRGRGGDPTDELKTYEFGDPFLLDLPDTVKNAVYRDGAHVPVKLAAEDFSVYRTELMTQSATAILVDVSRSMLFRGCFLAAKKVTLALDSLIRSTIPKDDLYIPGFSALACQLKHQHP